MIAYASFAFNHRLNKDNSLDKKSDVIGDLSYVIAACITRYMVVMVAIDIYNNLSARY